MGKLQWEAAFSSRVAWSLSCLLRRSRTCVVVRLTLQSGQQLGLSRRQQALKRPPLRGKDESLHLYWNFLQVYHSPLCSDSPWAKPIKLKHVERSGFFFFPLTWQWLHVPSVYSQGLGAESKNLYPFLLPVIQLSTDVSQPPHVYLLEDGLELW